MGVGEDPSEAAEDAVDEDRLLDGEDPSTAYQDDAVLWMSVYSELVAFKDDLVARAESHAARMQSAAAREVAATDLPVLCAEAQRMRRRLDFWTRRAAELA